MLTLVIVGLALIVWASYKGANQEVVYIDGKPYIHKEVACSM